MGSCHIAHDCKVGNNIIFANNTLLAGHVVVEVSPCALFGFWHFEFQDKEMFLTNRFKSYIVLSSLISNPKCYHWKSVVFYFLYLNATLLCFSGFKKPHKLTWDSSCKINLSCLEYLMYSCVSNVGSCSHCRGCCCSSILPCWFFRFHWWWLCGMT